MTTDTLDLPTITDEVPASKADLPAIIDLKRVDLQAVALAQFGDWRADVAAARQNLSTLVLDLSIPARIAEAKSLRQRIINAPIADARAVSKALKSKLTAVSKAVGAEEEAAVAAYTDAGKLITPKIEAAEARIEEERQRKEREEEQRIEALKLAVEQTLDPWLDRCREDGMTAERVQRGITALGQLAMPPEFADVAEYWGQRLSANVRGMEGRRLALAQQELEAEQAKIRAEHARVAGIQQRIAEIQAAATGHERATAADLDEARAIVRALRIDADTYAEFLTLAQAARDATVLALDAMHAAAVAREAEETAAAIAAQKAKAIAAALAPAPQPLCELTPGVTAPDAQEGVADNPLQLEPVADMTAGDLAADGAGAEAGGTVDEAPAAGRVILVEPDANAIWNAALRGDGTPQQLPAGVPLIRGELGTIDSGFSIIGNPPWSADLATAAVCACFPGACRGGQVVDGKLPNGLQCRAAAAPADDGPLETSEAEARPYTVVVPTGIDYGIGAVSKTACPHDEFVALVMTAFDCKFPSHPKPSQEWWTKVRAAGQALQEAR